MPGRTDRRARRRGLWVGLFRRLFDDSEAPVADGGREGEGSEADSGS